jgi:GntR family transcriptional regulator
MNSVPRTLRIDLSSSTPAYRQISDGLRALLVEGRFAPGDQLPTVRQLAVDLGVHHNTVAQAYRALAEEAWLELARGRGATVRDRSAPRATAAVRQSWTRRLAELVAQGLADGLATADVADALLNAADGVNARST